MFLFFLFFLTLIKFVILDTLKDSTMKVQEFQKMEKKAKTFACSLLAESQILSKKKEKQIRDYLKKNNFLKSDKESSVHDKIKQFKTAICSNNIYTDRANDILMGLSDGKYDIVNDKDNAKFFDFDKNNLDFNEINKNMKETN
jgi:predicted MPP superfamily phosphohydrolase